MRPSMQVRSFEASSSLSGKSAPLPTFLPLAGCFCRFLASFTSCILSFKEFARLRRETFSGQGRGLRRNAFYQGIGRERIYRQSLQGETRILSRSPAPTRRGSANHGRREIPSAPPPASPVAHFFL